MKTLKKLSLLFLATFVLTACSNDDDTAPDNPPVDPPSQTILEIAVATESLSILVDAVDHAGLAATLNGEGPFTVLAPTNTAFEALLETNNEWDVIEDVPAEAVRNILLNHVITGNVSATDLIGLGSGYTKTNAAGPGMGTLVDVYFNASATSVTFNGNATVIDNGADIQATNGTIHIVDGVVESTLLAFATSDSRFMNLTAAVTDMGQEGILEALDGASAAAPLTVFAPIDSAFVDLLGVLMLDGVSDIPDATLNEVLLHHVVGGNTTSDALSDGMTVTMANMQDISLMLPSEQGGIATITSAGGTESEVIVVDVQATNGVIHALDTVILPQL